MEDTGLFSIANERKTRPLTSLQDTAPAPTLPPPHGQQRTENENVSGNFWGARGNGGGGGSSASGSGDDDEASFDDMLHAPHTNVAEDARRQQEMKIDALAQIQRLCDKHHKPHPNVGVRDTLEDIQVQLETIKRNVNVEHSIAMQRRLLMTFVSTVEWANGQYDVSGMDLDGWSENIMSSIPEYDDVFERLYDKYKSRAQCPPEVQLMFMVGGSAFMFHMGKTMAMHQRMQHQAPIQQQPANASMPPTASASAAPPVDSTYRMRKPSMIQDIQSRMPAAPEPPMSIQAAARPPAPLQSFEAAPDIMPSMMTTTHVAAPSILFDDDPSALALDISPPHSAPSSPSHSVVTIDVPESGGGRGGRKRKRASTKVTTVPQVVL